MTPRLALAGLLLALAACASRDARVPQAIAVAPLAIPPIADAGELGPEQEGVGSKRITVRDVGPRRPGDRVEVEWNGSWYAAVLLAPRGSEWLVHYEGYEESWDEVVGDDRIREVTPSR